MPERDAREAAAEGRRHAADDGAPSRASTSQRAAFAKVPRPTHEATGEQEHHSITLIYVDYVYLSLSYFDSISPSRLYRRAHGGSPLPLLPRVSFYSGAR